MDIEISAGPAFAFGEVTLPPGGAVRVEAGGMAMTRGDIEIKTSTQGGFMKGLKRSLGGESFFVNDFTSQRGGVVGVSAALPGDLTHVPLNPSGALMVASGSWLASDPTVAVDSKWGGAKTFFSGKGLILLRCSGAGDILISSYGAIRGYTLAAGETMTLDTGHVVAFDDTVQFKVRKAGSWKTTILGNEGLVTDFTGPGRVWLQTRSSTDFITWIAEKLPPDQEGLLLAAIDLGTHALTAWDPQATGAPPWPYVYTLAARGGVVYVGGHFDSLGGVAHACAGAVDAAVAAVIRYAVARVASRRRSAPRTLLAHSSPPCL